MTGNEERLQSQAMLWRSTHCHYEKIGHWIIRDQSKIMRNIDDPCIRNGGDVNGKEERITIYDYSTTPGEPEMVISSKSQYMPSDWFSYCTLKPSILLKIVLETTLIKSCLSWSGFDTSSILKRLDDRCSRNGRDVDYKGRRPLKYRWASYLHKQICERSYLLKLQESRGSTKA